MESLEADTSYSWLVAFCTGVIFFIQLGYCRVVGIFYAESIPYFYTDREAAAYPYTLSTAMKTFAGPIAGLLYHIIGMQQAIILGSFLSCLGVVLCFFATDIVAITIFWGLIYGMGNSIVIPLLFQALNLYFKKNISKACGLALAGGSISGILLPSLCQTLLEKYGLSGTYLIMSAIALHCIPAGMLIQNPKSTKTHFKKNHYQVKDNDTKQELSRSAGFEEKELGKSHVVSFSHKTSCKSDSHNGFYKSQTNFSHCNTDIICITRGDSTDNAKESVKSRACEDFFRMQQNQETLVPKNCDECLLKKYQAQTHPSEPQPKELVGKDVVEMNKIGPDVETTDKYNCLRFCRCKNLRQSLKIFYNPSFIFLALVTSSTYYNYSTLQSIIIDYARDKGISAVDSKYFLMGSSFLDLFSKLSLGWITDGGYMTRKNYKVACSLLSAVTLATTVWSRQFVTLLICVSLEGLWFGASMSVFTPLICSYVEKDQQAMALTVHTGILFPLHLSSASIIGYFRDNLGSYDILVYFLMAIALTQAALLLSLPAVDRWWKNRTSQDNGI